MSDEKHEIVIIRRGSHGSHDEHHGGVWKIAFADFMTAMMAFFLVMWLIAANDKTRATVARYFNPVKLVDATVRKQGLHDPKTDDAVSPGTHDDSRDTSKGKETGSPASKESPKAREERLDAAMRSDPLVALAEIVGDQGTSDTKPKERTHGSEPVIGRQGGSAFRDPFAPPPPPTNPDIQAKDDDTFEATPPSPPSTQTRPASPPAKSEAFKTEATEVEVAKTEAPKSDAADRPPNEKTRERKNEDLTKSLMASLKTSDAGGAGPDISVRRTSEGVLVSLTDTGEFSMFTNGSAVPASRVVTMMARVAKVLATKPGPIVIRGFTDNKPFRAGRYDNWNLSVDRAQAAHYMLVRGGLSDNRIASVEGFADHGALSGVDPGSPLNRRIEILVKDDAK